MDIWPVKTVLYQLKYAFCRSYAAKIECSVRERDYQAWIISIHCYYTPVIKTVLLPTHLVHHIKDEHGFVFLCMNTKYLLFVYKLPRTIWPMGWFITVIYQVIKATKFLPIPWPLFLIHQNGDLEIIMVALFVLSWLVIHKSFCHLVHSSSFYFRFGYCDDAEGTVLCFRVYYTLCVDWTLHL